MFLSALTGALRHGARTFTKTTRPSLCLRRALYISTRLSAGKLSDYRLRKITEIFDNVYDTDKDGFIDKEDVDNFKSRARRYMERVHGKAVKDTYKAGLEDYLFFILSPASHNRNGFVSRRPGDRKRVSRAEWITLWEELVGGEKEIDPTSLPQWVRMVPHAIFPLLDCKGDGVVDAEEYRDFWHYVGGYRYTSDEDLERYFHHMTEGGIKPLDLPRVEELFADFYLSDDPDTPGRYIAGPISYRKPPLERLREREAN